jgi:carbon-monoxide dehydrogenase large subunit
MTDGATGLIGASAPRQAAKRLVAGKGRYTDDIAPPGTGHVAFLRSPYAHARILGVDLSAALEAPGVIAAYAGADLTSVCRPWVTKLAALPSHVSAPQYPMAVDEACWQGEAVAAVVATSRAAAEDALELIEVEWQELPALTTPEAALAPDAPPVHTALATNLALDFNIQKGDVEAAFAAAHVTASHRFVFGRQTGVSMEPRAILAEYNAQLGELTVHQSHQVPFQMREIFAEQLGFSVENVRVVTPDVGGAFGLKLHAYADEMAVVAISVLLGQPVRFTADRLESFVSDAHAREAEVEGRIALDAEGKIIGLEVEVLAGFGAYSCYPRSSIGEALQAVQVAGAPYQIGAYRGRVRGTYQNKVPSGAYRGVGQPIACAVTEMLVDLVAAEGGWDPAELRMRNFRTGGSKPSTTEGGVVIETISLPECLAKLRSAMDYDALRAEQAALRAQGILRGIGFSAFVEITGVGSKLYGPQAVRISAHEACRLSLQENGIIRCETSVTDQGQGTLGGLTQVVAEAMGVDLETVAMIAGDTSRTPYGGGAWASRGVALGGEAALRAASTLRGNILAIAASLLQAEAGALSIRDGKITNATGAAQMTLAELASTVRFRPDTIPLQDLPPLEAISHYAPSTLPYLATNGVQAALVEVDAGTGLTKVLKYWVADDCGRIVNPMLVDEQIRGGVVQGIGAALYESCLYSPEGQMMNGSLADYALPLATEMPEIDVLHVTTPTAETTLGARGVGEAGVVGSIGAMWTAVHDALRPLGVRLTNQPFSPAHVLDCVTAAEG